MIVGPLANLGIKLDGTLPTTIQQESGGHPELIQLFCRNIVDYFREFNKSPTTNDLLYQVSTWTTISGPSCTARFSRTPMRTKNYSAFAFFAGSAPTEPTWTVSNLRPKSRDEVLKTPSGTDLKATMILRP